MLFNRTDSHVKSGLDWDLNPARESFPDNTYNFNIKEFSESNHIFSAKFRGSAPISPGPAGFFIAG